MAFDPFTLADFRFVSGGIYTSAAAGNLPTTQAIHDASYPVSTGTGDQNINTPPVDETQCISSVVDHTSSRTSRMTHTTDILKRIRSTDLAGAAGAAKVSWSIFAPPAGLFV